MKSFSLSWRFVEQYLSPLWCIASICYTRSFALVSAVYFFVDSYVNLAERMIFFAQCSKLMFFTLFDELKNTWCELNLFSCRSLSIFKG